jgi:hypothetical protein
MMRFMEKNKKEERLEHLLSAKAFDALTAEEKLFVIDELGSEDQYNVMRKVSLALITSKVDLSPDPHILTALEQRMKPEKQFGLVAVLNIRFPAYAFVLTGIIVFSLGWTLHSSMKTKPLPVQFVEVVRHDTVYVAPKADTIYRNRIVYRQAGLNDISNKQPVKFVATPSIKEEEKEIGVTMKEKPELEMLLVSGTR